MIKQINLIALVAIGVTALFFGASIALAQAQLAQEPSQPLTGPGTGQGHAFGNCEGEKNENLISGPC